MSLLDNAELTQLDESTWKYKVECLVNEGESIYLDNGGCITKEELDALFTKAIELSREMAKKLDELGDKPTP